MSKINYFIISIYSLLLGPLLVSAADPYSVEFLNDDIEFVLEIIILVISLVAVFIGLRVRSTVKGGQLEKSLNALVLATFMFVLLEIYQIAKGLWFEVTGLSGLIKILIIIFLIIGFNRARQALE